MHGRKWKRNLSISSDEYSVINCQLTSEFRLFFYRNARVIAANINGSFTSRNNFFPKIRGAPEFRARLLLLRSRASVPLSRFQRSFFFLLFLSLTFFFFRILSTQPVERWKLVGEGECKGITMIDLRRFSSVSCFASLMDF